LYYGYADCALLWPYLLQALMLLMLLLLLLLVEEKILCGKWKRCWNGNPILYELLPAPPLNQKKLPVVPFSVVAAVVVVAVAASVFAELAPLVP